MSTLNRLLLLGFPAIILLHTAHLTPLWIRFLMSFFGGALVGYLCLDN